MQFLNDIAGLGTVWRIKLGCSLPDLPIIQTKLEQEIYLFEQNYSRFNKKSKLYKLNLNRKLEKPSLEMQELLNISIKLYNQTEGLFNACLGGLLESKGYGANMGQTESNLVPELNKMLEISEEVVSLKTAGNLDFGGFGKGYLIDKIGKILINKFNIKQFIINGGGDILVYNSDYFNVVKEPNVLLEDPFTLGNYIGKINLKNGSLAGSSNFKRRWKNKEGQEVGHILNPKNINEVTNIASFVVAENALIADVIATLICIVGRSEEKIKLLKHHFSFEYLQILPNGNSFQSAGFPKIILL